MQNSKILALFALILIAGAAAVVYTPSMRAPFILDDTAKIVLNPDIKNMSEISSKLVYPYSKEHPSFRRNNPSRPLTFLTYAVNYRFSKLNPRGYHIFNVILHILCSWLVFLLAAKIFPRQGDSDGFIFPLLAGLIFAVHPAMTFSVSYTYNRSDVLAALFYLLAVIFYAEAAHGGKKYAVPASIICFIFSLASKETGVTLPLAVLAYDFIFLCDFDFKKIRERKKIHMAYWAVLAVYLAARLLYLGGLGDMEASSTWSGYKYFLVQPGVVLRYIRMFLIPSGFSIDHAIGQAALIDKHTIFSFAAIAVIFLFIFLTIFFAGKFKSAYSGITAFAGIWFFAALAPASSFFPTASPMSENRLYLSGIGFCLAYAAMYHALYFSKYSKFAAFRKGLPAIICLNVFFLGVITYSRNVMYESPLALWKEAAEMYPRNERAHNNLGAEYLGECEYESAIGEFEKSISIYPKNPDVYNNLGLAFYSAGNYGRAEAEFEKAARLDGNNAEAVNNLGSVYFVRGDYKKAAENFEKSKKLDPRYLPARKNLASIHFNMKDYKKTISELDGILEIYPDNGWAKIKKDYIENVLKTPAKAGKTEKQ